MAGALLLWGQAKGAGVVQRGEKKARGRPYSSLPVPKGGLQDRWRGILSGIVVTEQGEMLQTKIV